MTDVEYAAHCPCDAFGVSTAGTNWDRRGIQQLAETHLDNCPAHADSIDVVERDDEGDETVVETVTASTRGGQTEADAE